MMKNDKVYVLIDNPGFSSKWVEAKVVKVNKVTVKVEFTNGTQLNVDKQYRVKSETEMKQHRIMTSIIHQL